MLPGYSCENPASCLLRMLAEADLSWVLCTLFVLVVLSPYCNFSSAGED